MDTPKPDDDPHRAWNAVAELYHAAFTGLLLATIVRRGTPVAATLVERIFSTQREARFLPGLAKLGLDRLPHAVAAAQYHYLSNDLGGVAVQYMPESDRKAWVRYVPPRWIWAGTAMCAVPDEITVAMLSGWHARNGVSLGNPRLGFVCTKTTTAGDAALEGYYLEHDRELAPHERLRFARDEDGPDFDPALAPVLASASWPPERLAKARRNYAIEYLHTALPIAVGLLGADDAVGVVGLALRQVGMQHHRATLATLGADAGDGAADFGRWLRTMLDGQGDRATLHADGERAIVGQQGLRLLDAPGGADPAAVRAWAGLWEGALASHDRRLALVPRIRSLEPVTIDWTIAPRAVAARRARVPGAS